MNQTLVTAKDTITLPFEMAALRVMDAQTAIAKRLCKVDLTSRRGLSESIWTILSVSAVAVIAVAFLWVAVPQIKTMGAKAAADIQAPPW